ncbi:GntR family transcriptional regulator [Nonomuraea helvata]|uniref:GntR family transcriptional regulator n=1 Tax=Nonomuraea helvata TaxID=37484 RepID=A0ABV5S7S4_9ACTN
MTEERETAKVDHDAAMPVYRQLAVILRDQIASGQLRSGRAIPTEKVLMEEHGLGRDSVRKALGLLREAGLIEAVQGRGTFVTERAHERAQEQAKGQ